MNKSDKNVETKLSVLVYQLNLDETLHIYQSWNKIYPAEEAEVEGWKKFNYNTAWYNLFIGLHHKGWAKNKKIKCILWRWGNSAKRETKNNDNSNNVQLIIAKVRSWVIGVTIMPMKNCIFAWPNAKHQKQVEFEDSTDK